MPSVVGICLLRIHGGRIPWCKDFVVDDKEDGTAMNGQSEFEVQLEGGFEVWHEGQFVVPAGLNLSPTRRLV